MSVKDQSSTRVSQIASVEPLANFTLSFCSLCRYPHDAGLMWILRNPSPVVGGVGTCART